MKGHCLEGLKCDWNPPPPSQCSGYSVTIILVYNKSKRKWKTTQHSTRTRVTENSKVGYNKQLKQIINTKRLKQKPWNWLSSLSYSLGVIIQTHVRLDGMCLLEWGIKIIVNVLTYLYESLFQVTGIYFLKWYLVLKTLNVFLENWCDKTLK